MTSQQIGCSSCWVPSAEETWTLRADFVREARLIGESHFGVVILRCGKCPQAYLSTFSETIDWEDGEDPQYFSLMALSDTEVKTLTSAGIGEEALVEFAGDRQCLLHDHPKGESATSRWSRGLWLPPHD